MQSGALSGKCKDEWVMERAETVGSEHDVNFLAIDL